MPDFSTVFIAKLHIYFIINTTTIIRIALYKSGYITRLKSRKLGTRYCAYVAYARMYMVHYIHILYGIIYKCVCIIHTYSYKLHLKANAKSARDLLTKGLIVRRHANAIFAFIHCAKIEFNHFG